MSPLTRTCGARRSISSNSPNVILCWHSMRRYALFARIRSNRLEHMISVANPSRWKTTSEWAKHVFLSWAVSFLLNYIMRNQVKCIRKRLFRCKTTWNLDGCEALRVDFLKNPAQFRTEKRPPILVPCANSREHDLLHGFVYVSR
jgi:hypothetical protein